MSKIPEYSNLSEKAKYFYNGGTPITVNIDDIFQRFEAFIERGVFAFRGCTEAKHKLYNSAQRYYISNDLHLQVPTHEIENHYHEFVFNLIEECKKWNNGTVNRLLVESKIHTNNSFAYLSYMQHYGIPSPFLDFTSDPYYALFFAINNVINNPSNIEIDNYFSVYYTDTTSANAQAMKFASETYLPNLSEGNLPYSEIKTLLMHILLHDGENYKLLNNTNIINQKGLFFYWNDPQKPIEIIFSEQEAIVKEKIGEELYKSAMGHTYFAGCFNIHKSLIPYLKDVLTSKGITEEYLFPNTQEMKAAVLHNATVKILRTQK